MDITDLKLIGVHEDGDHLLLVDAEGTRFRLPLDEPLRAAARRDRPRLGQLQIEIDGGLRPRDVQALIRSGLNAEEVADRSGWTVEKVRRFEGPVLAEREFMANKARASILSHDGRSAETFGERVESRLRARGVEPDHVEWDSQRLESGQWVVTVTFPAGGRQRTGSWRFDPAMQQVRPQNDDARFLGEDEKAGPLPSPHVADSGARGDQVFDVTAPVSSARPTTRHAEREEDELTEALRAHHTTQRGRRSKRRSSPSHAPGEHNSPTEALPLVPLIGDPDEVGPPPDRPRPVAEDTTRTSGGQDSGATADRAAEEPPVADEPGKESTSHAKQPAVEAAPKKGRTRVPSWDDVVFGTRAPRAGKD